MKLFPEGVLTPSDRELIVDLRREFHRYPELAFDEHRTAKRVEEELVNIGITPERIAGTGVVASIEGAADGATVLLRADMDALPIQEQNTHDYASRHQGRMHACGHDGHTATLLVTARILKRHQEVLPGRVILLFQPAEEGAGGAQRVLEDGLIERYKPDVCGGLHLWSDAPIGHLLATEGPFMASMDRVDITVTGRGGHGAIPHSARDPIVAAAQLIVDLQSIVSRRVDPLEAAVVTIGSIHGGEAFNVIPNEVTLSGTVRTFSRETQRNIESWIRNHCAAQATSSELSVEVEYHTAAFPTSNAKRPTEWFRTVARDIQGIREMRSDFRTMGSEDMSYLLDKIPGAYVFLGAGNPDVGASYPHHHPKFEIDEDALAIGAELLVRYALHASDAMKRA